MSLRPAGAFEPDYTASPALLPVFELKAGDPTVSDLFGPRHPRESGADYPSAEAGTNDVFVVLDQLAVDRHAHAPRTTI